MRISEDITIGEVIENYPEAVKTLNQYGLNYIDKPLEQQTDTLGKACRENGVSLDEIIKVLRENVGSAIE